MRTLIIAYFILSASMLKSQTTSVNASPLPQASALMMNGKPIDQSKLPNGAFTSANAVPIIANRRDTPDTTNNLIITYPENPVIQSEKKQDQKNNPK